MKTIATSGTLALLLFCSASLAFAQANLVTDGNMEAADTAAWRAYAAGVFAKSENAVYNGTQSMAITQAGVLGGFQQVGVPLTAGKTYKLKLFYRLNSGIFAVRVGINSSNIDFQQREFRTSVVTNAFVQYSRVFTVPDPLIGTVRVVIQGSGEVYVDDLSIVSETLINDGDMEAEGSAAYASYGGNYSKTSEAAYNGTQSMSVYPSGGFQQRYLPLEAGRVYTLSVYYRKETMGTLTIRIGNNSSNVDFEGKQFRDMNNAADWLGQWHRYTRTFTAPQLVAGGDYRLVFSSTGALFVDDLVLTSDEVLADWNCEEPTADSWMNYGVPTIKEKVSGADAYGGTGRSLRIGNGGVQQINLRVTPGATYDLNLLHKITAGQLRVRLGVNSSNVDFSGRDTVISTVGDWTAMATRTFTVPADLGAGSFRLVLVAKGLTSDISLDNISIRPH